MTRKKNGAWVFALLVAFLSIAGVSSGNAEPQSSAPVGEAAFQRMVDYLAREGGQWRAPNPRHEPGNDRSPDAIGLWFESAAQEQVLELTVVFHYGDKVRHSTRGYWYWHPGREEIVYQEVSPSGSVRSGTAHFENENTFITLTEKFSASGDVTLNRGVNVLTEEDRHETTAYGKGPDGEWVEQNALAWTRTKLQ